jgi:hypothetical protein
MTNRTIRVPKDATVFVLEDDQQRMARFNEWIPNARFASNVEDALPILALLGEDAVLFLDHDLCFADAAYPDARPGSGQRVAKFIASIGFRGSVYVHSVNERGAAAMKKHLPQAVLAPFGTFIIELV